MNDYVGLLGVNVGRGVILGDEPLQTAWWPVSEEEGIFVRWGCAENEVHVIDALRRTPDRIWQEGGLVLPVSGAPLYLFDSAYPGSEIGDHLTVHLPAGAYSIATALYDPDGETSLVLHRLRLITRRPAPPLEMGHEEPGITA